MSAQPTTTAASTARYAPKWILIGGTLLATAAGTINVVGFLGIHHQAISHHTGTLSLLSIDIINGNISSTFRVITALLFFFAGCIASSLIIRDNTLKLGRRYGMTLALESVVLFLSAHYFNEGSFFGEWFAAMACGLQNAMAATYGGAVLRTTHMSGIITDLGIATGQLILRRPVDKPRLRLYIFLISGFTLGGVLGSISFHFFLYDTLYFPATIAGITGFGYSIYKYYDRWKHRKKQQNRSSGITPIPE